MDGPNTWMMRGMANLRVLHQAIELQTVLNDELESRQQPRQPLMLKMAVPNQDVFNSHSDLTVVFLDENEGVLYVKASSNRHGEGDIVAILVGDIGPIQFTNLPFQNKLIEFLAGKTARQR
ncbi:MAG: hypothetical protein HZA94_03280 [Candidatus Vogelbacteria bacterium]|nr:hypothetical protein [Candidatus Vogelbacteria bacterium]